MGTIADDLTTDAIISYRSGGGAYVFSPAANILTVSHKPVYDNAQRTVVATRHLFVIEDVLQATDQLDGTKVDTTSIRQALTVPGGSLRVESVGVGVFDVNFALSARDCMWGPKPQMLTWQNYGNGKAGKITWQVECCTAEQCANAASTRQPMAYNYDVSVSKDGSGYERRSISGYVEIPITRITPNTRAIPDNVDRFKEQCYPAVPLGFRRTTDQWKVSSDRRTATFTYVDEQLPPTAPPKDAVFVEASHDVESGQKSLFQWTGTLTAAYEISRLKSRGLAWTMFSALLKSRLEETTKFASVGSIIPIRLRLSEPEIYGKKCAQFSCTYTYTLSAADANGNDLLPIDQLKTAVQATALWGQTPGGGGYSAWLKSMIDDKVFTARGVANLVFDPKSDSLIDLCLNQPIPTAKQATVQVAAFAGEKIGGLDIAAPTAEFSWLDYQLEIQLEQTDGVVELKPLPSTAVTYSGQGSDRTGTDGYVVPVSSAPASVIQVRTGPSIAVILTGRALRAGFNITPPQLLMVGGVKATPQNFGDVVFRTRIAANLGVPVVAAEWRFRYILPSAPTQGLGAPANPLLGKMTGPTLGFFKQR